MSFERWMGRVAGALEEGEYRNKLAKAGWRSKSYIPACTGVADGQGHLRKIEIEAGKELAAVDGQRLSNKAY